MARLNPINWKRHLWRTRHVVTSVWFWATACILLLLVLGLVTYTYWSWLSAHESGSSTVRNLVFAVVAVIALPFAIWRSAVAGRQADTAHHGLLNERYQKGAEMIGSEVLSVRLGGLYALQSLSSEYPEQYHVQIMRLFCAFVRHLAVDGDAKNIQSSDSETNPTEPRADVQAVMDAIGARGESELNLEELGGYKLDLRHVNLRRASLAATNLSNARFSGACLVGAALGEANLTNAILNQADLTGSRLGGAILCGARLHRAILQSAVFWTPWPPGPLRFISYYNALQEGKVLSADLSSAKLDKSDLSSASLQGAQLSGANLTDATLCGAKLSGAKLSGTTLVKTNLTGATFSDDGKIPATGLTQAQLDTACADPEIPPTLEGLIDAQTHEPLVWRGSPA